MTATLTFQYDFSNDPNDDFGWLTVEIVRGVFSGRGGFWVQWQDVVEFGESLSAYPIRPDAPLGTQWGFNMQEGEDLRLKIEIAPANATGDLSVTAKISDYFEPSQRVCASFLTNYPDIEIFKASIADLMSQKADSAVLLGR